MPRSFFTLSTGGTSKNFIYFIHCLQTSNPVAEWFKVRFRARGQTAGVARSNVRNGQRVSTQGIGIEGEREELPVNNSANW